MLGLQQRTAVQFRGYSIIGSGSGFTVNLGSDWFTWQIEWLRRV